jgi:hypothetical protein
MLRVLRSPHDPIMPPTTLHDLLTYIPRLCRFQVCFYIVHCWMRPCEHPFSNNFLFPMLMPVVHGHICWHG